MSLAETGPSHAAARLRTADPSAPCGLKARSRSLTLGNLESRHPGPSAAICRNLKVLYSHIISQSQNLAWRQPTCVDSRTAREILQEHRLDASSEEGKYITGLGADPLHRTEKLEVRGIIFLSVLIRTEKSGTSGHSIHIMICVTRYTCLSIRRI